MKQKIFLLGLLFSFCNTNIFANDTAHLYNQRLEQIKSFSSWLNSRNNEQLTFTSLDTNSSIWRIYDTALGLFFDKRIMDSLFQVNQQVLQVSAKYQMQKVLLSGYDNLISFLPFDSIKFKTMQGANIGGENHNDRYFRRNTITLYFMIDGKEYEQFGFFFAENSAKLTGLTEMGGDENRNKIVRNYIERLKTDSKKK